MLAKLKSNVAIQILAGVVFVLALLSIITSIIGYHEFTKAIENQYAESAYNTARTAANEAGPFFRSIENYKAQELQMRFQFLHREWIRLADTQDATLIYLFKADAPDYSNVTFMVSIANTTSGITPFKSGHTIIQTDERYLKAFREIYDEGKQLVKIAVYRPAGEKFDTGNHVTVMIPVKGNNNEIIGILAVERPMSELDNIRHSYLRHVLTAAAVLLLSVLTIYGRYLHKKLLMPIHSIAKEASRFARENTRPQSSLGQSIRLSNEIGQLARTIDIMEDDVLTYIENLTRVTQEKEQIKAELNIATQIQADMLPKIVPPFAGNDKYDLYATMNPAKEVGGDFYDFFMVDEDHLAMVMADVSGKGVPAALFMVIAKTLIKNRTQMGGTPSEILFDVNNQLCEGNEAELFVTVWLGILELSTGKVISSNAGHEYPAIKRAGGNYELLKSKHSPAVATMEGIKFRETEFTLNPGDSIYLYTDGVAEATNSNDELYGTDRMLDALNNIKDAKSHAILAAMKKSVDEFTGDAPQFDDITMLCIRYFGGKNFMKELTLEADVKNLDSVIDFVNEQLETYDCSPKVQVQLDVAVEELFVNIAHYAYNPETGPATVRVEMREAPLSVVITFIDNGVPYDPLAKSDPDVTLSAEEREVGGLGIFIVKKSMDNISYSYEDGKNILTIRKNLE